MHGLYSCKRPSLLSHAAYVSCLLTILWYTNIQMHMHAHTPHTHTHTRAHTTHTHKALTTYIHHSSFSVCPDVCNPFLFLADLLQGRNALHYSTVPESPACLQLLLRSAFTRISGVVDVSALLCVGPLMSVEKYKALH